MEIRPYQSNTVEAVFAAYSEGILRQLLVLATGLGKTYIAGLIIKELDVRFKRKGCRTLWLTHEEDLIEQSAISVMSTLHPESASMIKIIVGESGGIVKFMSAEHNLFAASECASVHSLLKHNLGVIKQKLFNIQPMLMVASVQTLINRLDKIREDHFDLIVVDEAQMAASPTFTTILNYFNPKLVIGLTATPDRLDGVSLGDLFDKIVADYDIKFGIDNGYLCEIEAISLATGVSLDNVRTTGGDFNSNDLKVVDCPERNNKIVDAWRTYAESPNFAGIFRPTQVFCVDVEHAQNMCAAFQAKGCRATFISGDAKWANGAINSADWKTEVKNRIKAWKRREIDVMCVVNLLTVGFDYPNLGCTIGAAPTKSKTRFLQGPVGRGTRLKDEWFIKTFGKNNLLILDPTDNSQKHQVVNTWSLDEGKRIEDRVFVSKETKIRLISEREKRRLEHNQDRDERRNLLALPEVKMRADAHWMHEDATEGQLRWLAAEGYDVVTNRYTKGHANEIINNFQVTDNKKQYLMSHGYDVAKGCTVAQYALAVKEIEKKLEQEQIGKSELFKTSPILGLT